MQNATPVNLEYESKGLKAVSHHFLAVPAARAGHINHVLKAMSTTALTSRGRRRNRAALRTTTHVSGAPRTIAAFVDLPQSPFAPSPRPVVAPLESSVERNPVGDLIPDDLFQLLRANDLISEMGIRNYAIRKLYHEIRQDESVTTARAMEKIQDAYPYLQLDTIRKIVYRIGPPANRKAAY